MTTEELHRGEGRDRAREIYSVITCTAVSGEQGEHLHQSVNEVGCGIMDGSGHMLMLACTLATWACSVILFAAPFATVISLLLLFSCSEADRHRYRHGLCRN